MRPNATNQCVKRVLTNRLAATLESCVISHRVLSVGVLLDVGGLCRAVDESVWWLDAASVQPVHLRGSAVEVGRIT